MVEVAWATQGPGEWEDALEAPKMVVCKPRPSRMAPRYLEMICIAHLPLLLLGELPEAPTAGELALAWCTKAFED